MRMCSSLLIVISLIQVAFVVHPASGVTDSSRNMKQLGLACEGKDLVMSCTEGSTIQVIRANYGRYSITKCNDHGILDWKVDCHSSDSFNIITNRCSGKTGCIVQASSDIFTDPCPGTRKYLEVHYQCSSPTSSSLSNSSSTSSTSLSRVPSFLHPSTDKSMMTGRNSTMKHLIRPPMTTPVTGASTVRPTIIIPKSQSRMASSTTSRPESSTASSTATADFPPSHHHPVMPGGDSLSPPVLVHSPTTSSSSSSNFFNIGGRGGNSPLGNDHHRHPSDIHNNDDRLFSRSRGGGPSSTSNDENQMKHNDLSGLSENTSNNRNYRVDGEEVVEDAGRRSSLSSREKEREKSLTSTPLPTIISSQHLLSTTTSPAHKEVIRMGGGKSISVLGGNGHGELPSTTKATSTTSGDFMLSDTWFVIVMVPVFLVTIIVVLLCLTRIDRVRQSLYHSTNSLHQHVPTSQSHPHLNFGATSDSSSSASAALNLSKVSSFLLPDCILRVIGSSPSKPMSSSFTHHPHHHHPLHLHPQYLQTPGSAYNLSSPVSSSSRPSYVFPLDATHLMPHSPPSPLIRSSTLTHRHHNHSHHPTLTTTQQPLHHQNTEYRMRIPSHLHPLNDGSHHHHHHVLKEQNNINQVNQSSSSNSANSSSGGSSSPSTTVTTNGVPVGVIGQLTRSTLNLNTRTGNRATSVIYDVNPYAAPVSVTGHEYEDIQTAMNGSRDGNGGPYSTTLAFNPSHQNNNQHHFHHTMNPRMINQPQLGHPMEDIQNGRDTGGPYSRRLVFPRQDSFLGHS